MFRIVSVLVIAISCAALPAWSFFVGPPFDPYAITIEEFAQDLPGHTGHYMLVSDVGEKQFILSGAAGPGWHATGHRFGAFVAGSGRAAGVCRFYAAGPATRFYTARSFECDALRNDAAWLFEGVRFEALAPSDAGGCPSQRPQVNRLYNNRAQFNDTNHRYVSDPTLRAEMVSQGWIDEGIAFCATSTSHSPSKSFTFASNRIATLADCQDQDLGGGSCIATNGLSASFPTRIPAPIYLTGTDPDWSRSFSDITGWLFDVYTGQPRADTAAVAFHSFLQYQRIIFPPASEWGIHLNGVDRVGGDLASIEPIMQASTRPPPPGGLETRNFLWRAARESYVDLAFTLSIQTILRPDAASHAYGAPLMEFRDVSSGAAIDVTMLTYATFPSGDFVSVKDPVSGDVYVSTSFVGNPAFGTRISGDFVACDGLVSNSCAISGRKYAFRISRADFERIIAMGRGSNAALSADPNDYMLASVRFRHGTVMNGRLGVRMSEFKVDIYGY